jgi:hypothetical protein
LAAGCCNPWLLLRLLDLRLLVLLPTLPLLVLLLLLAHWHTVGLAPTSQLQWYASCW